MKLAIAKLRLLGVLSLAGYLIALLFTSPKLANLFIIVALFSFAIIMVLYVRQVLISGGIKGYFSTGELEEDSESKN
jgi:hypothetical protein